MALYAIGDLHLSFSTGKPMDVFGDLWNNHPEQIRRNWPLTPEDTVVLAGDFSWAIDFRELEADMEFLASLPGRKILLKGNHDYWWDTVSKMNRFVSRWDGIHFLHNNCYEIGGASVCGTRGWTLEGSSEDERILAREVGRLTRSLSCAKGEPIVFLHYPPIFLGQRCEPILSVLRQFGVPECYYGHLHAQARSHAFEGESDGIRFRLISADHLGFCPIRIRD